MGCGHRCLGCAGALALAALASSARAQLTLLDSFAPGVGTGVCAAFDPGADRVWTYGAFAASLRSFSRTGVSDATIARPGESANDFDLSVAPEPVSIGGTVVPKDTLLVFNGETGVCEVYAVNKTTGAVLASVTTAFGDSHVVGGTYHAGRDTIFLVQDRVPGNAALRNLIAEINPVTGAVLNTFGTGDVNWTVNYGDIEAHPSEGTLWLVSEDETTVRILTPTGGFVEERPLPAGVSALSGLGIDAARGEAWVSGTTGTMWRMGGVNDPLCAGDVNGDGVVNIADFNILAGHFGQSLSAIYGEGDLNLDGAVNIADFNILASNFGSVCP